MSRNKLRLTIKSPPLLHVRAWCPPPGGGGGGRGGGGGEGGGGGGEGGGVERQDEQQEFCVVSIPSHITSAT